MNREELANGLRKIGLRKDMNLGVHSSLRSLGEAIDGGADTLIDVLVEIIGPAGTLMMTCHNPPGDLWSQAETPTCNGALSETFRRRTGVERSLHPTHSDCLFGPRAKEWIADLPLSGGAACHCPLHRLAEAGGFILLLGVRFDCCTLLHVAEELEKVPYIRYSGSQDYVRNYRIRPTEGDEFMYRPTTYPGCSHSFLRVEAEMAGDNLIRYGQIGAAKCSLTSGAEILRYGRNFLRKTPHGFLCDRTNCDFCVNVKRQCV